MSRSYWFWTADDDRALDDAFAQSDSVPDACELASKRMKRPVTHSAAAARFKARGLGSPYTRLGKSLARTTDPAPRGAPVDALDYDRDDDTMPREPAYDQGAGGADSAPASHSTSRVQEISREQEMPVDPAQFERLVQLARKYERKGGLTLEALCDAFDLSPTRAKALVDGARAAGYAIDALPGALFYRMPEPKREIVRVEPATPGREHRIGVFTDMHFGSKYNLGPQFTSFVEDAYADGRRDFFCPGDIVEGCYRHARWELSHQSWEDQAQSFLDHLPRKPGMRIWFIDGNHDFTWTETNGVESGRQLVMLARDQGRDDLFFCGSRGALIDYGGTRIELWHQKRGLGYAKSYPLQNKIRDTSPARKPHLMFAGHVHQYIKLKQQGVWAWYAGTFQHADAPFGRALGGDVAMGGLLVDWTIDANGIIRDLSDKLVEVEYAAHVFNAEPARDAC